MQFFGSSVNSPLKPPTQNNKDGTPINGVLGRRTSLSLAQGGNFTASSPTSRPGTRRRDSADLLQSNLNSPIGSNRLSKDEPAVTSPPPSLLRRRTDIRDNPLGATMEDHEGESSRPGLTQESSPFGPLKRSTTGTGGGGTNGPSSPWSAAPQSAGFASMGAFGNFSLGGQSGQPSTPGEKKGTFGSARGESRFKGLMNPESSEDLKQAVKEKESTSSLEKLPESAHEPSNRWGSLHHARIQSSEIHAYGDEEGHRTGSAALGGEDVSPQQTMPRSRNPGQPSSYEDLGFSSLGMSSDVAPFRDLMQRRDISQHVAPQAQVFSSGHGHEQMSTTNTNPYQSPEADKVVPGDVDADDSDAYASQYPGPGPFGHPRTAHSQLESSSNDRSRNSSVGASRGFPHLGNLGGIGGMAGPWSAAPGAIGTPSRAHAPFGGPFGDSMFGSLGDLNSPNQGGSRFFDGPSGAPGSVGTIGRGSKMGSLFPNAMQEQLRGELPKTDQGSSDVTDTQRHNHAPGFGKGLRENDSPIASRGMLDELFGNINLRNQAPQAVPNAFASVEAGPVSSSQAVTAHPTQPPFSAGLGTPSIAASANNSYFSRSQEQDTSAMPASQQRQMVMPDRMRWIYRDPQGNTQGPWSGLEMHDWYKAGFFSPELQVKKLEDADYEPLAQLIRRIGNSREPFLVPQIGIPHGSSTAQQPITTSTAGTQPATTPSAQPSSAQPPFASSFPSFGTTLTAEQQNALERRKQEEQYLMARQKEHLAQQQVMIKQMQHIGGPGQQLHHHSSAHSLQSQPSYGSITSPTGYQPSPAQAQMRPPAAVTGFFEGSAPRGVGPLGVGAESLGSVREDEMPGFMERLSAGRSGQVPYNTSQYHALQQEGANQHQQAAATMMQERLRLQKEQEQYDTTQQGTDDLQGTGDRLSQFNLLRAQTDEQHYYHQDLDSQNFHYRQQQSAEERRQTLDDSAEATPSTQKPNQPLSLSEQVQKAAALQSPTAQQQSPWAKIESDLPQPFPPPQSSSPLPAPAAQRNRQNVADALALESRSRSQTPSVETPSATIAPWAKESNETTASKGPSLKEIQAMEARKAAHAEELATAARRAAAEQERQNAPSQIAPAPGLPSSANWAKPATPTTTTGQSAWAKPSGGKTAVATPVTNAKRTLTQIQNEEEARKKRAAAAAAAAAANSTNATSTAPLAGGKRYADLASKAAPQISTSGSSAWTTVGAGGKVKTPTTPAAPAQSAGLRNTSTGNVQPAAPAKPNAKPMAAVAGKEKAQEEFQKWVRGALGKGLNGGIAGMSYIPFCSRS